ncbi:MAG: hypothetical protein HDQ97_01940 [Lachnospiraceae bacterium]|nr:hypothetical protein [Lachnospiraceae bacterium]
MKRLVLIEDAPWRAEKNLLELKEKGVEVEKIFFFTKRMDVPEGYQNLLSDLEDVLKVKIEQIGTLDFYRKLDACYENDDLFILFDLNLDDADTFEDRINVQYARSKTDAGKGKIWFYTTGGRELKSMLEHNFREQLIDVIDFTADNQLFWDMEQILEIAKEN